MKGMITCKICERDFPLIAEERYTVRDNEKSGVIVSLSGSESVLYDAFDCPHCGCQNVVQERKRLYNAAADPEWRSVMETTAGETAEEEE